jgi:hypothetical protein
MGGDHYTRVHNGVFRDARLSARAMGVFGHISTHETGWLTSAAQVARCMVESESQVKRALQELARYHYLVRGQERKDNGKLGRSWYFLTDLPAQLREAGVSDDLVIGQTVAAAVEKWAGDSRRSEP